MSKFVKFNDGTTLSLDELFKDNALLLEVTIKESLYGDIPEMTVRLQCDTQLVNINDKVNGYLIDPYNNKTEFIGYVYKVEYYNTMMTVSLLMVDPDFIRVVHSLSYPGLISGITSTFTGNMLTDLIYEDPVKVNVYQKNLSNHKFCTKCCWCYRYDNIFGYLIDGLRFIDLKEWKPIDTVSDDTNLHITNTPNWSDSKLYDTESEEVNFSIGNDPNHQLVKYFDKYIPVDNEFIVATNNYLHNTRYKTSKLTFNAKSQHLFPYKVGDFIAIASTQINFKEAFISARTIHCTKTDLHVFYTFQSIKL